MFHQVFLFHLSGLNLLFHPLQCQIAYHQHFPVYRNPFLDPITGGLINQYTDSQTYPYQDSYQVPTSPTQTLPDESLPLEEQQLLQENSLVDFTAPETTISSIVDGNNVQLQEGVTTTSNKVVLTIQGTDDVAVTGFQCVLDNLQQDPSICGTNPVVAENLQPGAHLFQISSVDSSGNIDTTPAVFSWSIAFSDQYLGGQQASQQLQQRNNQCFHCNNFLYYHFKKKRCYLIKQIFLRM